MDLSWARAIGNHNQFVELAAHFAASIAATITLCVCVCLYAIVFADVGEPDEKIIVCCFARTGGQSNVRPKDGATKGLTKR